MPVPAVVAGGTPVFPFHAARTGVEPSPGTTLLWDESSRGYSDLHFRMAAPVLTRVVSKPAPGLLCLDLGHKSIASEMPHPRARFFGLEDAHAAAHSEEHMVLETAQAGRWHVGDCLYAVPTHICPTVSCYERAYTVHDGRVDGEWPIAARNRVL